VRDIHGEIIESLALLDIESPLERFWHAEYTGGTRLQNEKDQKMPQREREKKRNGAIGEITSRPIQPALFSSFCKYFLIETINMLIFLGKNVNNFSLKNIEKFGVS